MKSTVIVTLRSGFRSVQYFNDAHEAMKTFNTYKAAEKCAKVTLRTVENGALKVLGYKKRGLL